MCASGRVCAPSMVCATVEEREWCVFPEQVGACAASDDGASCMYGTVQGVCVDAVCFGLSCGNGTEEPMEACDDGNAIDGDGCSSRCAIEDGWLCSGEPSICQCAGSCPGDMVLLPSAGECICMDRYEASQGGDDVAESVVGAMPWVNVSWNAASAACDAAGKRLCEENEWFDGCSGPPPKTAYPYGYNYDEDACNGSAHDVGTVVPTGSMATCEGGYDGLFDMGGNVIEWTATCFSPASCRVRGGSFLGTDGFYLLCDTGNIYAPAVERGHIGFRCCQSL